MSPHIAESSRRPGDSEQLGLGQRLWRGATVVLSCYLTMIDLREGSLRRRSQGAIRRARVRAAGCGSELLVAQQVCWSATGGGGLRYSALAGLAGTVIDGNILRSPPDPLPA